MATYKATTTIRHGGIRTVKNATTGEPEQVNMVHTFQPGDTVSGLSKGEMASLWEAGALEEVVSIPTVAPVKAAAVPEEGAGEIVETSGEKSGGDD